MIINQNMLNKPKKYHRDFEYNDYSNRLYTIDDIFTYGIYSAITIDPQCAQTYASFQESINTTTDFSYFSYEYILMNSYKFTGWYCVGETCETWDD